MVAQLVLLVVEHVLNPILFFSRVSRRSLVEAEVTCILFRIRLLQFPSEQLWKYKNWKCFMKNDGVRSSLIELQSFLQSKVDIDPIHHMLMFLPCFLHVLCMTRYTQVDRIRILAILVHGIHKQKEHSNTVCLMLKF